MGHTVNKFIYLGKYVYMLFVFTSHFVPMEEKIDLNLLIDFSETINKDLKTNVTVNIHEGKTKPTDFKIIKKLAKGGYGEVYIVEKDSVVYAMKKVSKQLVLKNPNTTFFMNEKMIMTTHGLDWLVKSHMCLQDETHLYYIMDFVHGGDLLGYLSKKDVLNEDEIRFYAAEIFTAINEMHRSGWIHRDLKPDNILIDREGHVKLADFGSCTRMENGKVTSNTTVGTPDYVSPDMLSSVGEAVVYGAEVDYWTAGVILYEMFYGVTPFYSNSLKETYSKITNIDFNFEEGISAEFKDLLSHLICRKEDRFGYEQVKSHKFFEGIDWDNLRSTDPPFKPQVESDADISNFVDTEFDPDNYNVKSGFLKFIGFTHDPTHVNKIINSIVSQHNVTIAPTTKSNNNTAFTNNNTAFISNSVVELKQDTNEFKLNEINRSLECKSIELDELKTTIKTLESSKDELSSQVSTLNQNLQSTISQILSKKDILSQIQDETVAAKEKLQQIKSDIIEKAESLGVSSAVNIEIREEIKDLKKCMERSKLTEKLDAVKEVAYWFYKQNQQLANEIKVLSSNDNENKSLEDLKKQLRMQKSEIRDYEQKIENEILQRKSLEDEIKSLKKSLREASRSFSNFVVSVMNALSNKEMDVSIENGMLKVSGNEYSLNTVFVRDLKNNELHHLPYKKRSLCLQMFFLNEPVKCSSSSGTRRSLKALEADLEKESKILKGLEGLICVLEGKSKEEAELQIKGSSKKIAELKSEIERSKRSTITDHQIDDGEKVYEFNSHLFYEKTVAKGTLCDHCNEVLYGFVNQAYCCKDCLLVVHKSCYVLVDVSCELNRAIKAGTSMPIICKTIEDKDRLLKLNKVI